MQDQIEEILKNSHKQGERIAIANLRHRFKGDNRIVDEETLSKLKSMKRNAHHDTSIPTDRLNNYYCSLCGRINLITNVLLDNLITRRTDAAIAIDLRVNFIKLNLQRDKIKHIQREKGVERYYRWKCQCGMPVGYSSLTYEELEEARLNFQSNPLTVAFFYVYQGALVEKMLQSKLISQLITYKETILLHLKRKNKK